MKPVKDIIEALLLGVLTAVVVATLGLALFGWGVWVCELI